MPPLQALAVESDIVKPAGSDWMKPNPFKVTVFAAGLLMVNVRLVESPTVIVAGVNVSLMVGGSTTEMLAEAVAPLITRNVPRPLLKVAVTLLVVLFLRPALVPVTFTETEQLDAGGRFKAVTVMAPLPGFAVTVAPSFVTQVPPAPLVFATTNPLGSGSFSPTLSNSVLLVGLVKVNVSEVVPFNRMLGVPKTWFKEGG